MNEIKSALAEIVQEIASEIIEIDLDRPQPQFGDLSTNTAMKLANKLGKNPREIAEQIKFSLEKKDYGWLKSVEIAAPGFINIFLSDDYLCNVVEEALNKKDDYGRNESFKNQTILVEYLDPNPFKELHIGHAYSGSIGDAIASLFEVVGASVHRVTYQGDVGLHVAKAIYGILSKIGDDTDKLDEITELERPKFLGQTYAFGAKAYEENEEAKTAINELNKKIYEQNDPVINTIYEKGKSWSLSYFDETYQEFGFTKFEKNYMEGAAAGEGERLVREHISDGIFEESDGAVIFRGENYGLHTRVFINSLGLPTYEAKDLGNAMIKWRDYQDYTKSIIITAEEQTEYFRVMLKALEQFAPQQAKSTTHIPHGMVKLSTGKMSSRTGAVVRALDLLASTEETARQLAKDDSTPVRDVSLAAIKYAFLKNRIGGDIVYDVNESLSLEGNSGPYLQYAHARARSILDKGQVPQQLYDTHFDEWERSLAAKISEFPEVVEKAAAELMPHHICTYLYELAQTFNRFYENDKVIGSDQQSKRLTLVLAYAGVLKNGLRILNIPAPDRM